MKIALIPPPLLTTPPRQYGGLEMVVYDLGVALAKAGNAVTLFAPKGSRLEGGTVVETIQAKETTQCNWVQEEVAAFNIYNGRLNPDSFDIIHDHTWFGTPYMAKELQPGLKICHTHHGHLDWNPKALPKKTEHINLIAISDFMRSLYEKMGHHAKFAYNGIEIEKYPFHPEKGNRLIFVGRFSTFKMPHIALDAARDTGHEIDLVGGSFVDDQSYFNHIKSRCANAGDKANMYIDAPHEKKIELLKTAKACIVPSKFMEPFGLVAVEALSCGTPVITLNDGALREVMGEDGVAGYVCDTYEDILRALGKIDKINPIDCRKRAEMFSRENMAIKYMELYKEVIEGREW